MAVTANNLANVSTTGFKKGRAVFEDLLYQNVRQVGAADLAGHAAAHRAVARHRCARGGDREAAHQGNMQVTGNSLDLAISGRGFFQVLLPDGTTGYTRDGSFQVNAQGELVTSSGYACSRASRSRTARSRHHRHRRRGQRAARRPDRADQVGSLQLVDFINPAGLQPRGENLLIESAASGPAQTGTPGLNGLGTCSRARSRPPTSTWSRSW
jgi:flagellar basal-body rod protein FlgG